MRRRKRRRGMMGGHGEEGAMPDHRVKVRRKKGCKGCGSNEISLLPKDSTG